MMHLRDDFLKVIYRCSEQLIELFNDYLNVYLHFVLIRNILFTPGCS